MSMSLREQLLAAGFGKKQAAQEAERKAKEQKRIAQAQAAQAAKAARAQALEQRRKEEAERKERWAQIRQLIEQHRLPKPESDEYFNFVARGKVRRVPVDPPLRERIIAGEVAIVRCEGRHDIVPREIAERIRGYDARAVISLQDSASDPPAEDDPYKDFVVPDDLKW